MKPKEMATILIPRDLHKKLKDQARREERQLQVVVERILNEALKSLKVVAA